MDLAVWESAVAAIAADWARQAVAYLPRVLGALGLVLIGVATAWLVRAVIRRVLEGVLSLLGRHALVGRAVIHSEVGPSFVRLTSGILFWLTVTLFVAAAVETLDLAIAAALVSTLATYLPRLLLGLVVLFGAVLAAQFAHGAVRSAASTAGLAQGAVLARGVQMLVILLGVATAADQVGIQSTLLTVVAATIGAAVFGGVALAFGLGSGLAVSNIIATFYVLKAYRVGQLVRIGAVEGEILEITQTGVVIASPEGRVLIPGRRFSEETSVLLTGGGRS